MQEKIKQMHFNEARFFFKTKPGQTVCYAKKKVEYKQII